MTARRACITCDFFSPNDIQQTTLGSCRAEPPKPFIIPAPPSALVGNQPPQPQQLGMWPPVTAAHWCGHWRQRSHAPDDDGVKVAPLITPTA